MRRFTVSALAILTMALGFGPSIASAGETTARAGARCARAGATALVGKTQLRCTKTAGRLVWRVVAAKPVPGPQPQPDPMLGTACTDPNHELLNAAGPIRCTDGAWTAIARAEDSVATRAYRNLITRYWSNPASALTLNVVSDTATAFISQYLTREIRVADRFWSVRVPQQPLPVVVARSWSSLWLLADALGLPSDGAGGAGDSPLDCSQGTFIRSATTPWIFFCYSLGSPQELATYAAGSNVGAHEFTHLAQYLLESDRPGRTLCLKVSPWFDEGLPSYIQTSLGAVSGSEFDLRTAWLIGLESTTANVGDFNYGNFTESHQIYSLGLFASEALFALEGSTIADRLLASCATGLRFADAFTAATGHSLDAWTPILDAYVASVKARQPMTLAQLTALRRRTFKS